MRTKDPKLAALHSIDILRELPTRRLRRLATALDEVTVEPGAVLIHQGGLNHHAYFVTSGSLCVEVDGTRVATLAEGSVVGERSAIDHGPANATVIAVEPTSLLVIDHRILLGAAADEPGLSAVLHELAAERSNTARADAAA